MVVYNKQTGEPLKCEAVDAKELIESGAYVSEAPKQEEKPKRSYTKSK